jgi:hypothetical protein
LSVVVVQRTTTAAADTPPRSNTTVVSDVKFVPVMTVVEPTAPDDGRIEDTVGAGAGAPTVTVASRVVVPPGPVQASVYVVVWVGVTVFVPETAPEVAKPVPVQDVASVVDQVRVADFPAVIVGGEAAKETVGGFATEMPRYSSTLQPSQPDA